jgi:hypothetical protein
MEITLRFAFRLRFRLARHGFHKIIDALSGCLYPLRRHTFPPPTGSFKKDDFATQSKSPLASSIIGLAGRLKKTYR